LRPDPGGRHDAARPEHDDGRPEGVGRPRARRRPGRPARRHHLRPCQGDVRGGRDDAPAPRLLGRHRRGRAGMSGLRARLAEERGFTMILAIMVLLIAMSVGVGAWTAASGDVGNGSYAHDQKRAWAGAEAGVQWYQAQLAQDPSYWSHCTNVPIPTGETSMPVNQKYDGVTPRKWRTIPGATDQFTVELLPAPGSTQCIENNDASMVDPATRTFRIRVTGRPRSGAASCDGATSGGSAAGSCPAKRSIIATFRRSSFLDFLYFSDYETLTPALQNFAALGPNVTSTPTDFQAWAA